RSIAGAAAPGVVAAPRALSGRGREQHPEARAFARARVDLDPALVAAHDPEHRGEPEPAPRELGGEERVEEARGRGRATPAPGVLDLEVDVMARGERFPEAGHLVRQRLEQLDLPGADLQHAAAGPERLERIRDEVHDHLPDLRDVAVDARQALGELVA